MVPHVGEVPSEYKKAWGMLHNGMFGGYAMCWLDLSGALADM